MKWVFKMNKSKTCHQCHYFFNISERVTHFRMFQNFCDVAMWTSENVSFWQFPPAQHCRCNRSTCNVLNPHKKTTTTTNDNWKDVTPKQPQISNNAWGLDSKNASICGEQAALKLRKGLNKHLNPTIVDLVLSFFWSFATTENCSLKNIRWEFGTDSSTIAIPASCNPNNPLFKINWWNHTFKNALWNSQCWQAGSSLFGKYNALWTAFWPYDNFHRHSKQIYFSGFHCVFHVEFRIRIHPITIFLACKNQAVSSVPTQLPVCFEKMSKCWHGREVFESLWVIYQRFGEPWMPIAGGALRAHLAKVGQLGFDLLCVTEIVSKTCLCQATVVVRLGTFLIGCKVECVSIKCNNTLHKEEILKLDMQKKSPNPIWISTQCCKDSGENAAVYFHSCQKGSHKFQLHMLFMSVYEVKWQMQLSYRFVRVILAHVSGLHNFPHSSFVVWAWLIPQLQNFHLSTQISALLSDSASSSENVFEFNLSNHQALHVFDIEPKPVSAFIISWVESSTRQIACWIMLASCQRSAARAWFWSTLMFCKRVSIPVGLLDWLSSTSVVGLSSSPPSWSSCWCTIGSVESARFLWHGFYDSKAPGVLFLALACVDTARLSV